MNREICGYLCRVTDRLPHDPASFPSRAEVTIAGYRHDLPTARLGFVATDPNVRASSLTALQRCGELDELTLLRALRDGSVTVTRRAVELSVHDLGNAAEVDEQLLTMLEHESDVLVEVVAWALGERHQEAASDLGERVAAALSRAVMQHPDPLVREAAVAALGSVGLPSGLPAVLHATVDKATVRRRAVLALAAFEGDDVDAALVRARTDRDWQVRQAAEDLTNPRV